jgi:hypothetical protein
METLDATSERPNTTGDIPELCLDTLMQGCRLVRPSGCVRGASLCDDEFGVAGNCPGQAMRGAQSASSKNE